MDTRKFLEAVLGDDGSFCIFAHRLSDKRKVQKFYPDLTAAINAAHTLDEDGFDAYFALGTFIEAGSRDASNVQQLKALFLDLDCGLSKDYADQASAIQALREFCKQLKLPRPTLVNSGRGIHVYWRLVHAVSREEWQPVADMLKSACREQGLHADPVVTADAARVLRVPGTHNHKDTPPTTVGIVGSVADPVELATLATCLKNVALSAGLPLRQNKFVPRESDPLTDALAGSFISRFKTIMLKTVAGKGCAQLGEVVMNQANVGEPLWRAGLSIAKFCVDGVKAVHRMSEKHPEYSPQATEEKVALIRGPYLCERFNEYRPGVCTECQHWGKIKSPISLGREVQEAEGEDNIVLQKPLDVPDAAPIQYVIPKYPKPYLRGKGGGVFKHVETDTGESKDTVVYINDLYVVRRIKDPEYGEALVMRLHLPRDGVREFTVPLTSVGTKDEFRKHLAMHGVAVLNVNELMEYTMKWVTELQFTSEAEEARRQFGWVDDSGTAFIAGNMVIYADRIEVNAPSSATIGLFPYFQKKGTLEGWKDLMQFYNRDGMEQHQFMVGLQFGSALMEFQPINAAAFHLHSKDSGLGKTTGMLAGASIWGDPDLLMLQERDTFNSKMNRAEVYKNLAVYMDEMTNTRPQDLSDWLYQMPSGMQRNRMGTKANTERVRGKPWKQLFGTTGNTDMVERISLYKAVPKAEAQRVFSVRAERVQFMTKAETDEFAARVKEHHGHAGVLYIQYVMNNLAAAKELADVVQKTIDREAGLTAENRFWSVLVSRTVAGIVLAKRAGLVDWDVKRLTAWCIGKLRGALISVSDMGDDVESTLVNYMSEHYGSVLRIKSTDDARKPLTIETIIQPAEALRGNLFIGRYEYDVKKLYLLPKPLKEWCGKQQINYAAFIDGLRTARTKAIKTKMRLTRGTHMSYPPTDVIAIDCAGFMDDETEDAMATTAAIRQVQVQDD